MKRPFIAITVFILAAACSKTASTPAGSSPATSGSIKAGQDTMPRFSHEVVVVLENRSFGQAIGNPDMPYLDSLAGQYGLAENYYANTHPSIGNYFMMAAGQVVTNDDDFQGTFSGDNIVRQLNDNHKTWKVYAESIPKAGYLGGSTGKYAQKHDPFTYFIDIMQDPNQAKNIVPFAGFSKDLASDSLPDLAFVVPNSCNDAHDCPLSTADGWLKKNIGPLVADSAFIKNGLLVITFDESKSGDGAHGGGHIATVLVGSLVKPGYRSQTFYQHQNLLRTLLDGLGIHHYPGAAATAGPMSDFFGRQRGINTQSNSSEQYSKPLP